MRTSAPSALASSSVPLRTRDAQHVAEAREDDLGLPGDRDAVVHAPHRDHADRAARSVHELDVRRQQVVDAVLVDRVRVAAADLHDLVVAGRIHGRGDLGRDGAAELGVAELVDVLHAGARSSTHERHARVDEHADHPARPHRRAARRRWCRARRVRRRRGSARGRPPRERRCGGGGPGRRR